MTSTTATTHTTSAPYMVTVDGRHSPMHQGQDYSAEEIASLVSTHGFESASEAEGFARLMREAGHTVCVQRPATITADMMTTAEIARELAALVQRLEVMADSLEDAQRFSDAHRLNAAIGYAEAVRRTLHDEGADA